MRRGVFALVAFLCAAGAAFAQPSANSGKPSGQQAAPAVLSAGGEVVRSCARELTVKLTPDTGALRAAYGSSYAATSQGDAKFTVYNSYVFGSTVNCQYRSQSGDILNLTYSFQCPAASPAAAGHLFTYRCSR